MSLLALIPAGGTPTGVQLPFVQTLNQAGSGTVYSGLKFDADGQVYRRQALGGWSNAGTWLFSGTASAFNITRTINSGSLTTDAGAGPLALGTDREYDIQLSSPGESECTVTFELDAGGAALATRSYTFRAIQGSS